MLKAAIVGYGYMGEIRKKAIEKNSDLELSMICETSQNASLKNLGCPIVSDTQKVFDSDCDIIFVCTPNNLIPDLTIKGLLAGKHVFSEKPPGRNKPDIEAIIAAERSSPASKLMFGFNHRYHPAILNAKKIVDSQKLGKLLWIRGLYGKSGGLNFKTSWRNKQAISGGGILLDQGIHMIDLFNYFCPESEFTDVKSTIDNNHWGLEVEDNAFVIMANKKGQQASLHSSATFWKHQFRIELGLTNGYLSIEGFLSKSGSYGREQLRIGKRQFEDLSAAVGNPSEEIIYFDRDESWDIEVKKFVDAIQKNKPVTESSSTDALRAMEIVEKAYGNSQFYRHNEGQHGILNRSIKSFPTRHQTDGMP